MAYYNQNRDWEAIGKTMEEIIDQAINSHDYQKLNQTITQTVNRAIDSGTDALRKAAEAARAQQNRSAYQAAQDPYYRHKVRVSQPQRPKLPVLYGNTTGMTVKGILKIVGGSMVSLGAAGGAIAYSIVQLVTGSALLTVPMAFLAAAVAGGAAMLTGGIQNLCLLNRFQKYKRLLGSQTHIALSQLSRGVGKSEKFVRRELAKLIDKGLFLEGHVTPEADALITSNDTYQHYLNTAARQATQKQQAAAEAARQQKEAAAAKVSDEAQQVLSKGNAFLREIHRCNDDIPGVEISEKIQHMEILVQKIFERAEAQPKVVPELSKLMDYYLPMTVKLLRAYADMDAQPIQGENIQGAKREIEATLDTLNTAFEKLLDSIFRETAMDVSSDISVLQALLAQEGLTEDELTKMRRSADQKD